MISIEDITRYEIFASWWTGYIRIKWMQRLVAKYFAWKAKRKWMRYRYHMEVASGMGFYR